MDRNDKWCVCLAEWLLAAAAVVAVAIAAAVVVHELAVHLPVSLGPFWQSLSPLAAQSRYLLPRAVG